MGYPFVWLVSWIVFQIGDALDLMHVTNPDDQAVFQFSNVLDLVHIAKPDSRLNFSSRMLVLHPRTSQPSSRDPLRLNFIRPLGQTVSRIRGAVFPEKHLPVTMSRLSASS